jgi:heme/copper-type cytochrome/quinol oxidase subunit 2
MNGTSLADLFVVANTTTEGWFGAMVLLATFALVFLGLKWGTSPAKAAAAASFACFLFSTIFLIIGITTWYVWVLLLMATIGCGYASFNEDR